MRLADIRPAEDVPAMQAMMREVQKSRSAAVPGIWRHRRKDGTVFHVRVSGHDLRFRRPAARMVQVIDVSAEVALQAEREQMIAQAAALARVAGHRHQRRAHRAVGARPASRTPWCWAGAGPTSSAPRAQDFGPVTEESFIELCHPDDLPRVAERFKELPQDPGEPYADEFRVKHLQRGWIWVLSRGKIAERSSDGRARRVVGTYVDISELKAAQSAREQQQAAEQASAMKSQFLGRVSHELRTPLNAVIGFSQLMQLDDQHARSRPQQAERIAHIERAGQHLLGLITDLMDLSRIELGAVELQREALDAGAAARRQPGDGRHPAARAPARAASARSSPACRACMADPLRLRQCLLNLLSNAIKYSHVAGHGAGGRTRSRRRPRSSCGCGTAAPA